jgi:hypothetical protein
MLNAQVFLQLRLVHHTERHFLNHKNYFFVLIAFLTEKVFFATDKDRSWVEVVYFCLSSYTLSSNCVRFERKSEGFAKSYENCKLQNFRKVCSLGVALIHALGQKDKYDETKSIFSKTNAPKNR